MWCIECNVTKETLPIFVPALELFSNTVSYFEHEDEGNWLLQALCEAKPNPKVIQTHFASLSQVHGLRCPLLKVERLPDADWLAENRKRFPPLRIGRFFIHGSHNQDPIPKDTIALQIDAATAFGSGEHATTSGCLNALQEAATRIPVTLALDLGCGSGILAMAIASLWPTAQVYAVDHDPEAVGVSKENCKINNVSHIKCLMSEGLAVFNTQSSFDLITANILADPLCKMSQDITQHLHPEGFIILSGILRDQADRVVDTYQAFGFELDKQFLKDGWATLTLNRRQRDKNSLLSAAKDGKR